MLAGGESCSAPAVLTPNTTVVSSTMGLADNHGIPNRAGCEDVSTGSTAPDAVFQTTIPPNSKMTITTRQTWDMVLNVVTGPATNCGIVGSDGGVSGAACIGRSDLGGGETVTVPNPSNSPLTILIVVDGYSTGMGPFELTTQVSALTAPGYTRTTTAGACVDMTAGVAVAGLDGDDVSSSLAALPFPFTLFGTPVTHFSMTSNGFAQLWPSMTGTTATNAISSPIPDTRTPNNFIAPFWDDLVPVTGTSTAKTLVSGTMPNRRFTLEWGNSTLYVPTGGRLERLSFQAQLVETSNVIEFHYCTLAVNGGDALRTAGNNATIGLENAAGTVGFQQSYAGANSATTATAFRFTP